jgi:hypothetical protein
VILSSSQGGQTPQAVSVIKNMLLTVPEYIFATLPRTQRGQPIVLGGDPKGKNFLYTNGNSVIIRNIEV